jgi:hypothetical protein
LLTRLPVFSRYSTLRPMSGMRSDSLRTMAASWGKYRQYNRAAVQAVQEGSSTEVQRYRQDIV